MYDSDIRPLHTNLNVVDIISILYMSIMATAVYLNSYLNNISAQIEMILTNHWTHYVMKSKLYNVCEKNLSELQQ